MNRGQRALLAIVILVIVVFGRQTTPPPPMIDDYFYHDNGGVDKGAYVPGLYYPGDIVTCPDNSRWKCHPTGDAVINGWKCGDNGWYNPPVDSCGGGAGGTYDVWVLQ